MMSETCQDHSWRPQAWWSSEVRKGRVRLAGGEKEQREDLSINKKKKNYHSRNNNNLEEFQAESWRESPTHLNHNNNDQNNHDSLQVSHKNQHNNSQKTSRQADERFLITQNVEYNKSSKFMRRATICTNIAQTKQQQQQRLRTLQKSSSNTATSPWFWWRGNNLHSQSHKISSMSNLITIAVIAINCCMLLVTANMQAASSCQYHQAMLLEAAARGDASAIAQQQLYAHQQTPGRSRLGSQEPNVDHLLVCPLASQYNALPQFPAPFTSPSLKRQQRLILSHLNASFLHHLPLSVAQQMTTASSNVAQPQTLDNDQLLNEIITPLVLDQAYESAKEQLVRRRKLEKELIRQGFITDMSKPTAVARHQRVTTTTSRGNELEKEQEIFEEMSRILAKNLTETLRLLSPSELSAFLASSRVAGQPATGLQGSGGANKQSSVAQEREDLLEAAGSEQVQLLSRIDLHSSEARHAVSRCEEDQMIICDPNFPYRHADGRCNNLEHPSWGKANTCFARLLPPDYSDGQSAPRISVTGHPLPNPRILSAIVHRDFNYPATYTHFVMQYGQFFAHDIAFTPSSRTKSGQMIQCCPIERDSHPQCFPILVPPDDPFYSNWEESCLNFVRTAVCPRCRLGPREQMNQITSYIDGSQVYGSAANETAALWTKSGPAGRMHVSLDDSGRELLPHSADPSADQCSDVEKRQFCYRAGDRRVNQHPALTSVHVMWLRQHNRIVNALKMHNPHWNGDRLYQEAKRICGAQMQMVTYNEWLSLIIGQDAMKFLKLNVLPTGYTKYDPSVDPSLLNEFSGSAFRFGHSMINNIFAEILPDGRPSGYRLNEFFFHPFGMKSGQYDMVMRGLISQASQNRDPFVSSDIKNHLYRPRDNPYGLDLPAFNIQRGRDHGIPGYTKLVQFCFDDTITNWKQLDQYMPVSQRIRFSKLYRSVHDLDLFSAGLAEYPLPGAALGPTFTCIVGIQMFNLKYGDRFWFEHGGQVGSFTPDQLQELRKTNLARLICANSDNINVIQRNTFRGESPSNPSVPCASLPDTDLKAWTEAPGTQNAFTAAMYSEAQQEDSGQGDRRPKRGERHGPQSGDKSPMYQQELANAFKSAKKGPPASKMSGNLGNMYTLMQVHPPPKQKMDKNYGSKQHQFQQPMVMKPPLSPPRSFKTQYKFMMTNNQQRQQQQHQQQQQRYHQSNSIDDHQMMDLHNKIQQQQQAEPQQQAYQMSSPMPPQMPMLPLPMQHPMPNLMDPTDQGPMQMYIPMS